MWLAWRGERLCFAFLLHSTSKGMDPPENFCDNRDLTIARNVSLNGERVNGCVSSHSRHYLFLFMILPVFPDFLLSIAGDEHFREPHRCSSWRYSRYVTYVSLCLAYHYQWYARLRPKIPGPRKTIFQTELHLDLRGDL